MEGVLSDPQSRLCSSEVHDYSETLRIRPSDRHNCSVDLVRLAV